MSTEGSTPPLHPIPATSTVLAPLPPREEESEALFFVALLAGMLGVLALLVAGLMFIGQRLSDEAIPAFAKVHWVFAAGVGLLVLGVGLQIHRVGEFVAQRRSLVALNVAAMTLLALALAVLGNYVGYRHYKEFDWTRSGLYSVSDETVQTVARLEKPIRIWVVWPSNNEDLETVKRLIDNYRAKSDKIVVEYADPTLDLSKFERTVKLLGLEDRSFEDMVGLVVQSGGLDEKGEWKAEKSKHLGARELFETTGFDPMSRGRGERKFKGESVLTNAIIEVIEPTKPKLYFLTGHGELNLEGFDAQKPTDMGDLTKILRQKNYDAASLDIMKRERRDVPDDASVLVIAGPQRRLDDQELAAIDLYLKNGGKVFFMLPPILKPNATNDGFVWVESGLESLVKRYGVELPQLSLVNFERLGPYLQPTDKCVCNGFDPTSKITQPFSGSGARVLLLGARPLKAAENPAGPKPQEVLKSYEGYFAVPDPEAFFNDPTQADKAERKAWPVLFSVEQKLDAPAAPPKDDKAPKAKDKVTKVLVCGDSRWLSNPIVDSGAYRNEPLFLNCVSWLVGQERFSKEAAKEANYKLEISPSLVILYSGLSILGLPAFAILLGLTVWMIRRR